MIDIPVYNPTGGDAGNVQLDEQLLGGEIRPALLKQAYVRYHANRRVGTATTKSRSEVEGSTRKLYRQKGTGNARRGSIRANIMRGGGRGLPKRQRSFRQGMPRQQRRLANRNALLAKALDGEIKLIDGIKLDSPSTKQFAAMLKAIGVNRSCLFALSDLRCGEARSARNCKNIELTQVDRLNAFDLLNHRYLLVDKACFESYVQRLEEQAGASRKEAA